MKKTLFLLFIFISTLVPCAFAQTDNSQDVQKGLSANVEEQRKTKERLAELRLQEVTLKNQIEYMDGQVYLTTLQIEQALAEIEEKNKEIQELESDITVLGSRIERMGSLVDIQRESFDAKVRHYYKERKIGFLEVIFGGDTLTSIVRRLRYLVELGKKDQELISQMRLAEANFKGQRTILSEKKEKVEDLRAQVLGAKAQMESKKVELNQQKQAKADLLALTQSDEKKYQEILARLKAEEEEMRGALGDLIGQILAGLVDGGAVAKGGVIGQEGSTGNVSPKPDDCVNRLGLEPTCGSHLHFMVIKDISPECIALCKSEPDNSSCSSCFYGSHVNPEPYLNDSNYAKPMDFEASWRDYVTQYYGETDFARSGQGGYYFHSGVDFAVYYGAPVYAIDNGSVYFNVDTAGGKFALVKHNENFYTAYWHLQ